MDQYNKIHKSILDLISNPNKTIIIDNLIYIKNYLLVLGFVTIF